MISLSLVGKLFYLSIQGEAFKFVDLLRAVFFFNELHFTQVFARPPSFLFLFQFQFLFFGVFFASCLLVVGLFSGLLWELCVILPAHSHCVYLILFVPFSRQFSPSSFKIKWGSTKLGPPKKRKKKRKTEGRSSRLAAWQDHWKPFEWPSLFSPIFFIWPSESLAQWMLFIGPNECETWDRNWTKLGLFLRPFIYQNIYVFSSLLVLGQFCNFNNILGK